jgi:hypothetical protein
MISTMKKHKWHKRHVTIDTPCHITELESILHAIADQGGWSEAKVDVDADKIVITFGNEPDDDSGNGMETING